MREFDSLMEVFIWTFSEREDFWRIKNHFNLSDEVEKIKDIFFEVDKDTLEKYLLDNSYIKKNGNLYTYEG